VSVASSRGRSPVLAIIVSIALGLSLAFGLAYLLAPDGSEALVTGAGLLAWGLGWALMAWLTTRFSGQPQRWLYVPAAALGGVGLVLAALQPGAGLMDLFGWVWPIALAVLVIWMFMRLRRAIRGVASVGPTPKIGPRSPILARLGASPPDSFR
jgi:peptidoglycan biosynthesis protein MviN/MurJ (putative lipid II flippase)